MSIIDAMFNGMHLQTFFKLLLGSIKTQKDDKIRPK